MSLCVPSVVCVVGWFEALECPIEWFGCQGDFRSSVRMREIEGPFFFFHEIRVHNKEGPQICDDRQEG